MTLKPADEVGKLIAGPEIYICDQCVQACVDILEQAPAGHGSSEQQLPSWQSMTDEEVLHRLPRIAAVALQVDLSVMHPRRSAWANQSLSSTQPIFQQGQLVQAVRVAAMGARPVYPCRSSRSWNTSGTSHARGIA